MRIPSIVRALLPILLFACAGELAVTPKERPSDPNAAEARFVPPTAPAPEPTASSTVTMTCPMHPEVTKNGPGQCPVCGMTLVPKEHEGHR